MPLSRDTVSLIHRLPKVELHLHLEGSVRPEALRDLARRKNDQCAEAAEKWIQERERTRFRYPEFLDFLNAFKQLSLLLDTPGDYAFATTRLMEELATQNVRYAEVTLSAGVVLWKGQSLEAIFEAVSDASNAASRRLGIGIGWIFDAVRQFGVDPGREVLRYAGRFRSAGVVGFGIGGDEVRGPANVFVDVYREARELGLHTTAHAGESAGPESVRDAVDLLKAERVGHGTCAARDARTMDLLAERQITIEACPTSNLGTGLIDQIAAYPLRRFLEAGVPVTINSDDPAFFNTTLEKELVLAAEHFSLSAEETVALMRNAIRGAFLDDPARDLLLDELTEAARRPPGTVADIA